MSTDEMKKVEDYSAQFEAVKRTLSEPEWVRDMRSHFAKTGRVRPRDLRRLMGDPCKCVEVGPAGTEVATFQDLSTAGRR